MNNRTKATSINPKVKKDVHRRDEERCILCNLHVNEFFASAHYIPRSKGGLGIKENIVTLCIDCHDEYDKTTRRPIIKEQIKKYLNKHYPEFTDEQRIYRKGQ